MEGKGSKGGGKKSSDDADETNVDGPGLSKRSKTVPECIIHSSIVSEALTKNLSTLKDLNSWKDLCEAAEINKHQTLLNIARSTPEGTVPHVHYHRKCRQHFILEKRSVTQSSSPANSQEPGQRTLLKRA